MTQVAALAPPEPVLHIAEGSSIPLDMATSANAILGIRGSGKTTTARDLGEELLENGVPIAVIDPTGAWSVDRTKDGVA